jgi:hypothetical protein
LLVWITFERLLKRLANDSPSYCQLLWIAAESGSALRHLLGRDSIDEYDAREDLG